MSKKQEYTEFEKWIHDDICWCVSECSHTECERHTSNRWLEDPVFTATSFKGTDMCPLSKRD